MVFTGGPLFHNREAMVVGYCVDGAGQVIPRFEYLDGILPRIFVGPLTGFSEIWFM